MIERETQNFASLQADAIKLMHIKITETDASCQSRDARFCVSQGGKSRLNSAMRWWTKSGMAGRETQNLASLQAGAIELMRIGHYSVYLNDVYRCNLIHA